MPLIFSFFRTVVAARSMQVWAGPVIFILLFLASLTYVVAGGTLPLQSAASSQDDVSRFIAHPSHCDQLLGKGLGGDTPHPDMHTALEAALDATGLQADQAIRQINARCSERPSASERISHNSGS